MIVSNASPLIYVAKIKKIQLLKELYKVIIIPEEVKNEVVDQGKKRGESDAFLIEEEIKAGWIKVEKVTTLLKWEMEVEIGEKAAISLAKEKKQSMVLIDDKMGRIAAKIVNVEPIGTIAILLFALKQKKIIFDEFLHLLTLLAEVGFRLQQELYTFAIEEARRITKN